MKQSSQQKTWEIDGNRGNYPYIYIYIYIYPIFLDCHATLMGFLFFGQYKQNKQWWDDHNYLVYYVLTTSQMKLCSTYDILFTHVHSVLC